MQPENDTQAVRRVLARAGITAATLALTLAAATPAAFAGHGSGGSHDQAGSAGGSDQGHNPPGNNGTVKIHDVAGDLSHHNVPHVDCDFWVPMWGFDAGQDMVVSFAGQAPTGKDTPVTFTAPDGNTLRSTTDAGGGNDYDGELGFSTTAESLQSQLGAPAHEGYHVKMTVATGAPGGHKYKVFWIQCAPTTGGTTGGGTTGSGGDTSGGGTTGGGTTAGAVGSGTTSAGSTVLGEKITRATTGSATTGATAAPAASSLPFTGAEIGGLAAAGAAALGGGGFLMAAGRRRRRGAHRA